jgi:hypothetical protein
MLAKLPKKAKENLEGEIYNWRTSRLALCAYGCAPACICACGYVLVRDWCCSSGLSKDLPTVSLEGFPHVPLDDLTLVLTA